MSSALRNFIRESLLLDRQSQVLLENDVPTPRGIAAMRAIAQEKGYNVKAAKDVTGLQWTAIAAADAFINGQLPTIVGQIEADVTGRGDPGVIESDQDYRLFVDNVLKYLGLDQDDDAGYPFRTTLYIAAWLGQTETLGQRVFEGLEQFSGTMVNGALFGALLDRLQPELGTPAANESRLLALGTPAHRRLNAAKRNPAALNEGLLSFIANSTSGAATIVRLAIKGSASAAISLAGRAAVLAAKNAAEYARVLRGGLDAGHDTLVKSLTDAGIAAAVAEDATRVVTYGALKRPLDKSGGGAGAVLKDINALGAAARDAGASFDNAQLTQLVDAAVANPKLVSQFDSFAAEFLDRYAMTTRTGRTAGAVAGASSTWFGVWTAIAAVLGVGDALISDKTVVLLTPEAVSGLATAQAIRIRGRPLVRALRAHLGEITGSTALLTAAPLLTAALDELAGLLDPNVLTFIDLEDYASATGAWSTLSAEIN